MMCPSCRLCMGEEEDMRNCNVWQLYVPIVNVRLRSGRRKRGAQVYQEPTSVLIHATTSQLHKRS